jgi:hypothetical protein
VLRYVGYPCWVRCTRCSCPCRGMTDTTAAAVVAHCQQGGAACACCEY